MIEAYIRLHEQGFAASIEVWDTCDTDESNSPRLVGGLYGVCIGKAFFGESMFSLVPSASKLALIHLARVMHERGGRLIDCQFETPHLKSMGGRHITYKEYMEILNDDGEDA
jgi:leucyl/phenylalanyl-tRNA--protein transferase